MYNSSYLHDLPGDDVHQELPISAFSKMPGKGKMLGIVGSDGQPSPLVFVASGGRLNPVAFQALLRWHGLPRLKMASPDGHYVFYQDGGPCHAAPTTRYFLEASMAVYWPPDLSPPSSPHLLLLEYRIWGILESQAQGSSMPKLAALKNYIRRQWAALTSA